MPAISPSDLILWRTNPYSCALSLYFDSPPIIFQAQVDAPSGITYPAADIGFKNVTIGSHSVLRPGMLVVFESALGADDQGRSLIRRTDGSASQVRIGYSSQGENDGTINAANNSYIKVYDDRRIFPEIPYIDPNTLVSYKFFDFDFATYGVNEGSIVNLGIGPVWFKEIGPTDTFATLSISSAANSYGFDGNIVSWANDIVDGTYTSGGATTAAWTATFPPGRRYIKVATTDTNSVVTYRELLVIVAKDGTAWQTVKHWELTAPLNLKWGGTSLSLKVLDDIPRSTYPDGFLAVIAETETFGDTTAILNDQSLGSGVIFCGWHQVNTDQSSGTVKGTLKDSTLTFLDVAARLDTLPGFSQEMCRKATPTIWSQKKGANWDAYESVLLRWHSTAMRVTDFHGANQGDLYAFSILGSGEQTLYRQQEELADRGLGYHFTCTMQGRLLLNPDPQLLPVNLRTSVVIIELQDGDITDIRITDTRPPKTYWEKGGSVLTSTSDFDNGYMPTVKFALGPGNAPGMGSGTKENNQQLCVSLGEILIRTANRYARENANFGYVEVDLKYPGNFGYDPAYLQWVKLNLSAENAAQRGITFNGQRCLLIDTKVTYRAGKEGVIKDKVTLLLEVETVGSGVVEEIQPVDPNPPAPQPTITTPTNTGVINCDGVQAAIGSSGNLILRADYLHVGLITNAITSPKTILLPRPQDSPGLSGITNMYQIVPDPFGSFWINRTGAAPCYCLADFGVYYISDIFDCSQVWTTYVPLLSLESDEGNPAVMRLSHALQGELAVLWTDLFPSSVPKRVAWLDHTGILFSESYTNFGANRVSAIDIDQHGAREIWYATNNQSNGDMNIHQLLNGVDTIKHHFNWAGINGMLPSFIQKPQLTSAGLPNTSTSTPTILFAAVGGDDQQNILLSSDGFATFTNISKPGSRINPALHMSSMIAGDNPNIMIMSSVPFSNTGFPCATPPCSTLDGLWVSLAPGVWNKIAGTSEANTGKTCGYLANNHNRLYATGTSDTCYINGLSGIAQSTLGDWSINGVIHTEIPL